MSFKSYRDLEVWQKAMALVVDCYRITRKFPKSEIYGLGSQLQRAAVSIPANIAEGRERQYNRCKSVKADIRQNRGNWSDD